MPFEDAFNSHNLELLRKAGTLLYGSTWFADNWRFWCRGRGRRAERPALASGDGGDILMFGSATTWNPLLAAGLVDEVIVLVGAALMGEGSKLYSGPRVGLRLLSARTLPDSQLVELRYAAGAEGPAGLVP